MRGPFLVTLIKGEPEKPRSEFAVSRLTPIVASKDNLPAILVPWMLALNGAVALGIIVPLVLRIKAPEDVTPYKWTKLSVVSDN
jgi:hypothetical protein